MKIIITESQYKKLLESHNTKSDKILIVGDSHSVDLGYTYSSLLKKVYPNTKIIAANGMSTTWMKDQLEEELSHNSYDKVIIWGGNNDCFGNRTISDIIHTIQEMVDLIINADSEPYVIVGYDQNTFSKPGAYLKEYGSAEKMNRGRKRYIKFQEELPNTLDNAIIIPAFRLNNSFTSDNLHGNASANEKVYEDVKEYLEMDYTDEEGNPEKNVDDESNKTSLEILSKIEGFIKSNKKFEVQEEPIQSSEDVKILQQVLQFLKYQLPEWGADGGFGQETKQAVTNFQSDNGLTQDGILDSTTMQKLIDVARQKGFEEFDTSDLETEKTDEIETVKAGDEIVIENPGITVNSYPSNIEDRFKKVVGDYYEDFVSGCESIGLNSETAIRQIYTESIGYLPKVINCKMKSPKGAMGIAQIMPGVWSKYGEGNPCNPIDSLKVYLKLMEEKIKSFPGRIDLAVASYNSGPNVIDKKTGKNVYFEALKDNLAFTEIRKKIPKETYKYTSTILQA